MAFLYHLPGIFRAGEILIGIIRPDREFDARGFGSFNEVGGGILYLLLISMAIFLSLAALMTLSIRSGVQKWPYRSAIEAGTKVELT